MINWPLFPVEGQTYIYGQKTYKFDGRGWVLQKKESTQPNITVDNTVTEGSPNPVSGDAVFNAIQENMSEEPVFPATTQTSVALAALAVGTDITGKTALEVLDLAINAELWPKLTAPSYAFTISPSELQEVGAGITIVKSRSFSRGSISPQYQSSSPYRSGALIDYTEAGVEGAYTVVLGVQSWTSKANYEAGVQPKGSKGTNYSTPIAAGSTSIVTRTITGVYPVYATTANIGLLTKQTLLAHGSDITVSMVAESTGKQTIRIPQAWGTIAVLEQYNTVSDKWVTIALSTFKKTEVDVTVNGNKVSYWEYVHNGSTIGARELKFKL